MSTELIPVEKVQIMATAFAKSGLFGVKTVDQALSLCLIAQAEGLHPAIAARDYHVIQGRPALKADALLARFQAAGGKVEWHEYTDAKVSATFSHPQGGSVTVDWDMSRAKAAELGGKDNWKKYPRQMLRARVISEGIRTVYPGCSVGIYTVEEVQDMGNDKPAPDPIQDAVVVDTKPAGNGHDAAAPTAAPAKNTHAAAKPETYEEKCARGLKWLVAHKAQHGYVDLLSFYNVAECGDIPANLRDKFLVQLKAIMEAVRQDRQKADAGNGFDKAPQSVNSQPAEPPAYDPQLGF